MSAEVAALALTFLVHVAGAAVLVWYLVDGDGVDWRGLLGDDGRDDGPEPDAPAGPGPGAGGLPLPDARPSAVRLREPGRLSDAIPAPARRPAHPPQPARPREPVA